MPLVVVVPGATVQELSIDSRSSPNGHAEDDGSGAVVDASDWRGADDESAGTAAIFWWVEVADCAFDRTVLDDENSLCVEVV